MEKKEFLDLDMGAQLELLNGFIDAGKSKDEAAAEVGCDLRVLMANGLVFVKNKFMGKAFRGYGTAKSSANEHKHEGAVIAEKGANVNLT